MKQQLRDRVSAVRSQLDGIEDLLDNWPDGDTKDEIIAYLLFCLRDIERVGRTVINQSGRRSYRIPLEGVTGKARSALRDVDTWRETGIEPEHWPLIRASLKGKRE